MSQSDGQQKRTAVALKYDELNNVAPVVVATGVGYLAEKITFDELQNIGQ